MKRAFLLGTLAAGAITVFASPSRADTIEPCHSPKVSEAPCLPTPPCTPAEAPCQG